MSFRENLIAGKIDLITLGLSRGETWEGPKDSSVYYHCNPLFPIAPLQFAMTLKTVLDFRLHDENAHPGDEKDEGTFEYLLFGINPATSESVYQEVRQIGNVFREALTTYNETMHGEEDDAPRLTVSNTKRDQYYRVVIEEIVDGEKHIHHETILNSFQFLDLLIRNASERWGTVGYDLNRVDVQYELS